MPYNTPEHYEDDLKEFEKRVKQFNVTMAIMVAFAFVMLVILIFVVQDLTISVFSILGYGLLLSAVSCLFTISIERFTLVQRVKEIEYEYKEQRKRQKAANREAELNARAQQVLSRITE